MRPIQYSRQQVALMVRVRARYFPWLFVDSPTRIARIAAGLQLPTPTVLRALNLTETEDGYQWVV